MMFKNDLSVNSPENSDIKIEKFLLRLDTARVQQKSGWSFSDRLDFTRSPFALIRLANSEQCFE